MKLFLLCFLAALIAAAKSLSCECTNCTSGTICTADKRGVCVAVTGKIKIGSNSTSGIYSGCWSNQTPLEVCKEEEMFITAGKQFSWNTKTLCCHEDNCNAVRPEAPEEDATLSELMCPTCFTLGSDSCNVTMMRCAESQDHCLTITGTITTGSTTTLFFGEGCATPTASTLASGAKLTFGEVTYLITGSHIEKAKVFPVSSSKSSTTLTSSKSSTIPPSSKHSATPPSSKPSTIPPSSKHSTIPASSKPSTIPASSKPSTIPASSKHSTIPASSKHSTIPASSKHSTIPPSSKHSTIPVSSKHSTIPASSKHSTIPASSKHSTIPPSSKHSTIPASMKPHTASAKPATTSTSATSATSVFTILLPSLLGLLLGKFLY